MNPVIWKILPYVVGAGGVIAAVVMFGAQQRAIGEAQAHRATAARLQEVYTADSAKWAGAERARAEELKEANRQIAVAVVKQQLAAKRADSATAELRAQLQPQQQAQLDAIASEHARERTYFELREAQWASKLRLKDAELADLRADRDQLRQINIELRESVGQRPGFVQKAIPFALGGGTVAAVIAIVNAIK